jgi:hypothetical protein
MPTCLRNDLNATLDCTPQLEIRLEAGKVYTLDHFDDGIDIAENVAQPNKL